MRKAFRTLESIEELNFEFSYRVSAVYRPFCEEEEKENETRDDDDYCIVLELDNCVCVKVKSLDDDEDDPLDDEFLFLLQQACQTINLFAKRLGKNEILLTTI